MENNDNIFDKPLGPVKPIVVKVRIGEPSILYGLAEFQRVYGVSQARAVKMALHQYFDISLEDPSIFVQAEDEKRILQEALETLKTIKVSNRILIKKIFDLNQEEYKKFMEENRKKFDKD